MIGKHKKDVVPSDISLNRCVDTVNRCSKRIGQICFAANTPYHVSVSNEAGRHSSLNTSGVDVDASSNMHTPTRSRSGHNSLSVRQGASGAKSPFSLTRREQARIMNIEMSKHMIEPIMSYIALRQEEQERRDAGATMEETQAHVDDPTYDLYYALGCMHRWLIEDDGAPETNEQQHLQHIDDAQELPHGAPGPDGQLSATQRKAGEESIIKMLVDERDVPKYSYPTLVDLIGRVGLLPKEYFPYDCYSVEARRDFFRQSDDGRPTGGPPPGVDAGIEHCTALMEVLRPPEVDPDTIFHVFDVVEDPYASPSSEGGLEGSPTEGTYKSVYDAIPKGVVRRNQVHVSGLLQVWARALTTYFLHCELLMQIEAGRRDERSLQEQKAEAERRRREKEEADRKSAEEALINQRADIETDENYDRKLITEDNDRVWFNILDAEEEERNGHHAAFENAERLRLQRQAAAEEEARRRQAEEEEAERVRLENEARLRNQRQQALMARLSRLEDEEDADREEYEIEEMKKRKKLQARISDELDDLDAMEADNRRKLTLQLLQRQKEEEEEEERRRRQQQLDDDWAREDENAEVERHKRRKAHHERLNEQEQLEADEARRIQERLDEQRRVKAALLRQEHLDMVLEEIVSKEEPLHRRVVEVDEEAAERRHLNNIFTIQRRDIAERETAQRVERDRLRRLQEQKDNDRRLQEEQRQRELEAEAAEAEEEIARQRQRNKRRKQQEDEDQIRAEELAKLFEKERAAVEYGATAAGIPQYKEVGEYPSRNTLILEEVEGRRQIRLLFTDELADVAAAQEERYRREEDEAREMASRRKKAIMKARDDEEREIRARRLAEEEARLKREAEEEEARQKQEAEEDARRKRKAEEEARKRREAEEEEARQKQEAEEARKKREAEAEARRRRDELLRQEQEEIARRKAAEQRRRELEDEIARRLRDEEEARRKAAEEAAERRRKEEEDWAVEEENQRRAKASRPVKAAEPQYGDDLATRLQMLERENRFLCRVVDGINHNQTALHTHVLETDESYQGQISAIMSISNTPRNMIADTPSKEQLLIQGPAPITTTSSSTTTTPRPLASMPVPTVTTVHSDPPDLFSIPRATRKEDPPVPVEVEDVEKEPVEELDDAPEDRVWAGTQPPTPREEPLAVPASRTKFINPVSALRKKLEDLTRTEEDELKKPSHSTSSNDMANLDEDGVRVYSGIADRIRRQVQEGSAYQASLPPTAPKAAPPPRQQDTVREDPSLSSLIHKRALARRAAQEASLAGGVTTTTTTANMKALSSEDIQAKYSTTSSPLSPIQAQQPLPPARELLCVDDSDDDDVIDLTNSAAMSLLITKQAPKTTPTYTTAATTNQQQQHSPNRKLGYDPMSSPTKTQQQARPISARAMRYYDTIIGDQKQEAPLPVVVSGRMKSAAPQRSSYGLNADSSTLRNAPSTAADSSSRPYQADQARKEAEQKRKLATLAKKHPNAFGKHHPNGLGGWNMFDEEMRQRGVGVYGPPGSDPSVMPWMNPRELERNREDHLKQIQEEITDADNDYNSNITNRGNKKLVAGAMNTATTDELEEAQERQEYEINVVQQLIREIRYRSGLVRGSASKEGNKYVSGAQHPAEEDDDMLLIPTPCIKLDFSLMAPWITDQHFKLVLHALLDAVATLPPKTGGNRSQRSMTSLGPRSTEFAHPGDYSRASTFPNPSERQTPEDQESNVAATIRIIDITRCRYIKSSVVIEMLAELVNRCPMLCHVMYDHRNFPVRHVFDGEKPRAFNTDDDSATGYGNADFASPDRVSPYSRRSHSPRSGATTYDESRPYTSTLISPTKAAPNSLEVALTNKINELKDINKPLVHSSGVYRSTAARNVNFSSDTTPTVASPSTMKQRPMSAGLGGRKKLSGIAM